MQHSAAIKVQTDQSTTTISRTSPRASQQEPTTTTNENNDTDIFVVCSYGDLSSEKQ